MSIHEKIMNDLGATAYWTAAVRAQETKRADPLVYDPWAGALAGEPGRKWLENRPEGSTIPILLRTRFFDDYLQWVVSEHQVRQVVLLAAGLDTRAFRLTWPDKTRFFELDQSEVLDYKEQVLHKAGARPNCDRRAIRQNLTGQWGGALTAGGFSPDELSAWLLEGFLFYLPNETLLEMLAKVSALAAPGSGLGFDVINAAMLTSPITRPWIEMQAQLGAPWIGTLDDPESAMSALGWSANLTQAGQPDAHYGRWTLPVFPIMMPGLPHNWFVRATKVSS